MPHAAAIFILPPLAAIETVSGSWAPLVWLLVFLLCVLLALCIRACGRRDAGTSALAKKPFISGNDLASQEDARIGASHMYWGFTTALRRYYARMMEFHSGNLTDYILWFLVTLALFLLLGRLA